MHSEYMLSKIKMMLTSVGIWEVGHMYRDLRAIKLIRTYDGLFLSVYDEVCFSLSNNGFDWLWIGCSIRISKKF